MTRTLAILIATVAACKSSENAQASKEWAPKFEKDKALYQVLDEKTDARVVAATHDERLVADFAERRIELVEGWVLADEAVRPIAPPTPVPRRRGRPARPMTPARQLPNT